jgi:alkylation response protein AidB-like acyl-CoA dehydrogenase
MTASPSLLLSRRDLEFLLYEWLDVEALCTRERFADHNRETFDAAINTAEKIASEQFAPHNRKNDQHEPHFDGEQVRMIPEVATALAAYSQAGLMASGQDYAFDGMQLPAVVQQAIAAHFFAANVGSAGYALLTVGNANTILKYGTPDLIERFVRPMLQGRFFGTMCLSEPQAGSSLSDIATRARLQADGTYRLFGNKMWISGGEQSISENIVHLVLAKIPGPDGNLIPGVKGISLFVVPKFLCNDDGSIGERNDVVLAGLNHKMGSRGTTNCLLNFGEGKHTPHGSAGAIGYLIGQPHQGLAYMFSMMNEARIGVGLSAVMLGYTGYLHALEYARNRPQGRHPASKDPASAQITIIGHTDVRRMLLAQKAWVEGGLGLILYCSQLVDDEKTAPGEEARRQASMLLDFLTPIAKSWPSQWCLEANSLAIQVHGGYGYTREFPVEQFYRDNRLNAIHEGTHGIHGLDLLGRKVTMQQGALLQAFVARVTASCELARQVNANSQSNSQSKLSVWADALQAMLHKALDVTRQLHACGDMNRTLANASLYLEAIGHICVAWVWLQQAMVATRAEADDFYRGKLQACQYFFAWELPKVAQQLALLGQIDTTALDMQDAWF